MRDHEYRVVPTPSRPERVKGLKSSEDRLARTLTELMNRMAAEGWEYLRADTLPCEERRGLLGRRETQHHTLLIFRRATSRAQAAAAAPRPAVVDAPASAAEAPDARPAAHPEATAAAPAPRPASEPDTPRLSRVPSSQPDAEGSGESGSPAGAEPAPRTPVLRAEKPTPPAAGRRLFGTTGLGNRRPGGPHGGG